MWRAVLATTGSPGLHETASDVLVLDVTDPSALALAVEDDDTPLVVAAHTRDAHAAAVAASFLTAHRPGRLVAHVSTRHAPLAALVCLCAANELSTDAGHGVSVWSDLLDAAWSGVLLSSVAGLTHPDPPLSQHLRSWLPGSRFLVRLQPEPLSERADRPGAVLAGLGRGQHDMVVSDGGAQDDLVRRLTTTLAPSSVRTVSLPGAWDAVFGRRELLQLALMPTDVRGRLRPRGATCPGCGLAAAGTVCAFCRTRTVAPPVPPATRRGPGLPGGAADDPGLPGTDPLPDCHEDLERPGTTPSGRTA